MAKKETGKTKVVIGDELLQSVYNTLKTGKHSYDAYILGQQESPSTVKSFISTGNEILDLIISNRRHGGIAIGRVTEVFGDTSTGKSLLMGHIIAEVQKLGGVAVFIDSEFSVSEEFLVAIGVDLEKMIYIPCELIEDAFMAAEDIILDIKKNGGTDKPVAIIMDSIMGFSNKVEIEDDYEQRGYATQKARLLSTAMRKIAGLISKENVALILTNQIRTNLNAMFGADKSTTSGGKAIPFHATTRMKLANLGKIKDAKKNVLGGKILAEIKKSKLGPAFRKCEFDIYYASGIDKWSSWFKAGQEAGCIVKSGNKWKASFDSEEDKAFSSGEFINKVQSDLAWKDKIYDEIADYYIMKYETKGQLSALDENSGIEFDDSDDDE
jgi:recombination protein RecA